MSLFRRPQDPSATPLPGVEARLEALEDKYARLWRRFERLHGEFNALYVTDDEDDVDDLSDLRGRNARG